MPKLCKLAHDAFAPNQSISEVIQYIAGFFAPMIAIHRFMIRMVDLGFALARASSRNSVTSS